MELQIKVTILAFCLKIFFKYISLKLCRKKVELQNIAIVMLAFIIAHLFTFIEIFTSSYYFKFVPSAFSFHPTGLL